MTMHNADVLPVLTLTDEHPTEVFSNVHIDDEGDALAYAIATGTIDADKQGVQECVAIVREDTKLPLAIATLALDEFNPRNRVKIEFGEDVDNTDPRALFLAVHGLVKKVHDDLLPETQKDKITDVTVECGRKDNAAVVRAAKKVAGASDRNVIPLRVIERPAHYTSQIQDAKVVSTLNFAEAA